MGVGDLEHWFCFRVRTGSLVIGWFHVIASILIVAGTPLVIADPAEVFDFRNEGAQ